MRHSILTIIIAVIFLSYSCNLRTNDNNIKHSTFKYNNLTDTYIFSLKNDSFKYDYYSSIKRFYGEGKYYLTKDSIIFIFEIAKPNQVIDINYSNDISFIRILDGRDKGPVEAIGVTLHLINGKKIHDYTNKNGYYYCTIKSDSIDYISAHTFGYFSENIDINSTENFQINITVTKTDEYALYKGRKMAYKVLKKTKRFILLQDQGTNFKYFFVDN